MDGTVTAICWMSWDFLKDILRLNCKIAFFFVGKCYNIPLHHIKEKCAAHELWRSCNVTNFTQSGFLLALNGLNQGKCVNGNRIIEGYN